jgi:hypothetical protein
VDASNLVFYAAVCGALAAFSPQGSGRPVRAVIGIVVGLVAASALPYFKSLLGLLWNL